MAAHCGLKTKAWQNKAEAAKRDAQAATKVPVPRLQNCRRVSERRKKQLWYLTPPFGDDQNLFLKLSKVLGVSSMNRLRIE